MKHINKLIGAFGVTATLHMAAAYAGDLTVNGNLTVTTNCIVNGLVSAVSAQLTGRQTGNGIFNISGALVTITNTANGTGSLGSYSEGLRVGGETAIEAFSQSGISAVIAGPGAGVYSRDALSDVYGELAVSHTEKGGEFPNDYYYGVYGNDGGGGNYHYAGFFDGAVTVNGNADLAGGVILRGGTLVVGNVDVENGIMTLTTGYASSPGPALSVTNQSTSNGSSGIEGYSSSGYGVEGIGGNIGVYAHNTVSNTAAYLATAGLAADLYGDVYVHGKISAMSYNTSSDKNLKENFTNINPLSVLAEVVALPISKWNFKQDSGTDHLGPMAQDFYAAFNIGSDDKHIATVDESGVALAAIQGLNQKVEEDRAALHTDNEKLKRQNESVERRLEKIEQLLENQTKHN